MKLLHYIDDFLPTIGGGELYVDTLIRNLPSITFDVLTNAVDRKYRTESYYNNSTIYRISPANAPLKENGAFVKRGLFYLLNVLRSSLRLTKKKYFLKHHNYDVVHFHGEGINIEFRPFDKLLRYPLLSRIPDFNFLKGPRVLTLHSFISYFTNHTIDLWWEKKLIDMFDNIICVDLFIFNKVKCIMGGRSKQVWYIPNSVDTKKFTFEPITREDKLKVLFVGRLTAERGLEFLQDFIKYMPAYVDFTIVGAGSQQVSKPIKEYIDRRKISFFANVSNDQLPRWYHHADVIVNFVKVPGISRITLEAMACGRPVIMFNIEDRTPVVHGETGFLIKEDVGELVALLDWINTNRGDLTDISYKARKIVELEYDNCIIMERLAKVYHSLVAR